MIQGGDTIKIEKRGTLQTHTVAYITETKAHYSGGSIAKVNLCRCGDFWLEMAAARATVKTTPKPKSKRGKKLHFVENDEVWGNLAYCAEYVGDFEPPILYSWHNCGLVKSQKRDFWYFRVSDIARACELRDPIGRLVNGEQFYSMAETARRIGGDVTQGCIDGWIHRGSVESHRPKGALLAVCWADIVQYCRMTGREIENES